MSKVWFGNVLCRNGNRLRNPLSFPPFGYVYIINSSGNYLNPIKNDERRSGGREPEVTVVGDDEEDGAQG